MMQVFKRGCLHLVAPGNGSIVLIASSAQDEPDETYSRLYGQICYIMSAAPPDSFSDTTKIVLRVLQRGSSFETHGLPTHRSIFAIIPRASNQFQQLKAVMSNMDEIDPKHPLTERYKWRFVISPKRTTDGTVDTVKVYATPVHFKMVVRDGEIDQQTLTNAWEAYHELFIGPYEFFEQFTTALQEAEVKILKRLGKKPVNDLGIPECGQVKVQWYEKRGSTFHHLEDVSHGALTNPDKRYVIVFQFDYSNTYAFVDEKYYKIELDGDYRRKTFSAAALSKKHEVLSEYLQWRCKRAVKRFVKK
jgi:hypothetical protein